MKSLVVFMCVILVGAVALGLTLGDSELSNPKQGAAEAERIRAETAAFIAQNNYEQQRREIELRALEERSAIEAQALAAQRAKELELMERDARLKAELFEVAVMVGLGVVSAAVLLISGALTWYLICRGYVWVLQRRQLRATAPQRPGRVVPFPQPAQQAAASADCPAEGFPDEAA